MQMILLYYQQNPSSLDSSNECGQDKSPAVSKTNPDGRRTAGGGATAARPELPFDAEIGTFYCKASNEVKAFTSMSSLIEVSGGIQSVSILNVT